MIQRALSGRWSPVVPSSPTLPAPGAKLVLVPGLSALFLVLAATIATPLAAAEAGRSGPGFRATPLASAGSADARPHLTLLDAKTTGLNFSNSIPEARHLTNQILLNGSGIATGDVDGDGLVDVYCAGFDNDGALFRNRGNWRFEDITATAGVALAGLDCTGAALADLDGDGDLDLVVQTLVQGARLLLNDGHGHFTPSPLILNPGRGGMTVAVADFDGDGWLDLYLTNYRRQALMDMPGTRMTFKKTGGRTVVDTVNGRPATDPEFRDRFVVNETGGIEENGEPDVLYRNVGGTNFVEVPWTGGAFLDEAGQPLKEPPRDWGLAAMFRDVNGDGLPDLYVCNDFQSPDRLWLNLGGGRFRLAPPLALRRTSLSSMAVDFADVNRDGFDDFLVLEMMSRDHGMRMRWVRENFPYRPVIGRYDDRPQIEQNTLQWGRGDGTWSEAAQFAGLEAAEWAWACAFLDVDLDGWEDLLVVNGMERAARDLDATEKMKALRGSRRLSESEVFAARRVFPRLATPNLAFRNRADGTFTEVGREWGFDLAGVSQAIALADLDNDGDLDVLVGNLNAPLAVYRNEAAAPRVAVRLAGRPPNTRGVGARIDVLGGPVPQSQQIVAGGRYLSGDDLMRSFAAGTATKLAVRVRWPGGVVSEVADVAPNSLVTVEEPATAPGSAPASPSAPPAGVGAAGPGAGIRFEDVSAALGGHRHVDEAFDDFARQPLLLRQLGQAGPGVAWADLDGDGDDDLVVGAGRGGTMGVFRNDGKGGFARWDAAGLAVPVPRDVLGLAALPGAGGKSALVAALDNYEDGAPLGAAVWKFDPASPNLAELATATESSGGALALADIDGDGDLDLFLGGRVIPGRWPEAASSRFLRNDQGRFVPDEERSRALAGIGLVQGALFTDLDGDGDADLVLACEWGPIRVLRQDPKAFVDITEAVGLAGYTGWWTSVATGDFDGDGHLDLVAGNWGLNTPWERARRTPLPAGTEGGPVRVYHGDFNDDGVYDVLGAYFEPGRAAFVPDEQLGTLAQALPTLRGRFPSHAAFGQAGVADVLGPAAARARVASAAEFASAVFLWRGGKFELRRLPTEAQLAPVFGVAVADVDGDGCDDVFVAQNFHALRPHWPRCDGGVGVWLAGDGKGGFHSVPGAQSGVRLFGEQRGAALGDFDGDGRVDLVVGQNGAETKLFRNVGGRPGLRVRLAGTAANPGGIGARIHWASRPGPVREVHAGEGCFSQNSLVTVLARPEGGDGVVHVVWPGGGARDYRIPAGMRTVVLEEAGLIRGESP